MPPDPTTLVRAAYDAQPWPPSGQIQGPALSEPWLFAPVGRFGIPAGGRILVAGCGTGGEVASLASRFPGLEVVGVDLSPRSVALAREAFPGFRFEVADLARDDLAELGAFDLISCHATADYVPDARGLFARLGAALSPSGVLYLGTNSADHSGARIRAAMGALGLGAAVWTEDSAHRAGLRVVHQLLGENAAIRDLPQLPTGLLAADLFPAFSHAADLDTWCGWAASAGLVLGGSMAAVWALPSVSDGDLPLLYGQDRAGLARLVVGLRRDPVLQLVFVREPAPTPPWTDPAALAGWRLEVHPGLGPGSWPPLTGDWMARRFLAVGGPGLPELRIELSAWMLELLRRADGRPIAAIRAEMPVPAHDEHLRAALFRTWQAGWVALRP